MPSWNHEPVFCFTSDTDWCSDDAWKELHQLYFEFGVRPTYFLTHESDVLSYLKEKNEADFGIHPNFSSTNGTKEALTKEIQNKLQLTSTKACRAHRYYDSNDASYALFEEGIRYDATGCTRLAPNLVPLHMNSGLIRFLTFWEDGSYSEYCQDWTLETLKPNLLTPGLKIFNTHPINFAFNVANRDHYQKLKQQLSGGQWSQIKSSEIAKLKNQDLGPQTLLQDLLKFATKEKVTIKTLADLFHEHVTKP